ncbi:hypothetical protein CDO52_07490 [Nocardiopsis gilva YIM 90087]|uniref:Pyrrolo-quinoline quinone n=1 Tax=Nocardiopsis gilva YIM 90087 TaxID=1235441 RepID=A0A223S3P9_9ACTN|nr:hypothetical protein [Nocardiopsis gilva]ASU82649.1 hypothetical protein CDO52_07490 [Nocardiopsis gilva YIM 90087]
MTRHHRRARATALGAAGCAALVALSSCTAGGGESGEEQAAGPAEEVTPLGDPAEKLSGVDRRGVPPPLDADALAQLPVDGPPTAVGEGFIGTVLPTEEDPELTFVLTDADGTSRWSRSVNPSCTSFTVSRTDGRDIVVLLDNDFDPVRNGADPATEASGYDAVTGERLWGPVDVPGAVIGPGLVFGDMPGTVVSDDAGAKVALSPADGSVAADETDGVVIDHEHNGVLLAEEGGELRARDTVADRDLWSGSDLHPPKGARGGEVDYARAVEGDGAQVLLSWTPRGGGDRSVTTVNDLRTGTTLAVLPDEISEPRALADPVTGVLVATSVADADGFVAAYDGETGEELWRDAAADYAPRSLLGGMLFGARPDGAEKVVLSAAEGTTAGQGTWPFPIAATPSGATAFALPDAECDKADGACVAVGTPG